jgi:type II secretory pathway component GspD/PulD (secretin)
MRRLFSRFGAIVIVSSAVGLSAVGLSAAEPKAASETESRILKALEEKTTFEFVETPLADVAEYIAKMHKIQVVLDRKALDDSGIGSDTPITRNLSEISLRSALRLTLKELDLTWVVADEVLQITTVDEAGQKMVTRVYDVRDLVADEKNPDEGNYDYDSLIDLITSTVEPTTWDQVGGPGSIAPLRGMLIFSQTQHVHEQATALLADLRRVRKERGDVLPAKSDAPVAEQPVDPNLPYVKVYKVLVPLVQTAAAAAGGDKPKETLPQFDGKVVTTPHDRYLDELSRAIPALVRPESWERQGGTGVLFALPADASGTGHLLVRQTAEVHGQLQRFLSDLQAKGAGQGGIGGGGFF